MTAVPRTARFWHHIDALVAHGESLVRAFHRVLGASSPRIKPLTSSVIAAMRRGMDAVMPAVRTAPACVPSAAWAREPPQDDHACRRGRCRIGSHLCPPRTQRQERAGQRSDRCGACNSQSNAIRQPAFLHPEVLQTWNLWARWAAWEPSHSPTTPKRSGKLSRTPIPLPRPRPKR